MQALQTMWICRKSRCFHRAQECVPGKSAMRGQDMITVDEGLIKVEENDCYMYKVQDVKLTATLPERIFGLGTIICYTGDVTDKELRLSHIKHAKEIKNYLLKASEAARIKRRTLNMQDIGASLADDVDL